MSDFLDSLRKDLGDGHITPPCDPQTEKDCPHLWQVLTQSKWADDTERILPIIKVERVPGAYRATLQDDSLGQKKTVYVKRLCDLADALEAALVSQDVPWEQFKSYRNKTPKVKQPKKGG